MHVLQVGSLGQNLHLWLQRSLLQRNMDVAEAYVVDVKISPSQPAVGLDFGSHALGESGPLGLSGRSRTWLRRLMVASSADNFGVNC